MLVLTRKINQKIFLGNDNGIQITLLGIDGKYAKIGINAPKEVRILRDEHVEDH